VFSPGFAGVVGPAPLGCSVEVPVAALDHARLGYRAVRAIEGVQRS
jgi:hypothetical protein